MKRGSWMTNEKAKFLLQITIPLLLAVFSFFVLFRVVNSSEYNSGIIASIDESRDTVIKLTASATAASVAITALPGDIATPVADKLAEITQGFLVVLCALYLEKFLMSISCTVVFKWLIPIVCGLYVIGKLFRKEVLSGLAYKILILSAALLFVVPVSVKISSLVEDTYSESIEQTIESAQNSASQIEDSVSATEDDKEAGNGLGQIINKLKAKGDLIANGASQLMDYFQKLTSRFIESVAIMIVISCIIPVLVILFFVWLVKILFNISSYQNYKYLDKLIKKDK